MLLWLGMLMLAAAVCLHPKVVYRLGLPVSLLGGAEALGPSAQGLVVLAIVCILSGLFLRIKRFVRMVNRRPSVAISIPLLLAIVGLDVGLRPFVPTPFMWQTADPVLAFRHLPGVYNTRDAYTISINQLGLHGPEIPLLKPPGELRIFLMGDSTTFGHRIESYRYGYPFVMQQLLQQRCSPRIQVLNGAVVGYGTWHYIQQFRYEVPKFDADLVILNINVMDIQQSSVAPAPPPIRLTPRWQEALRMRSAIWQYSRHWQRRIFTSLALPSAEAKDPLTYQHIIMDWNNPAVQNAWHLMLRDLEDIIAIAESQHQPLMFTFFPFRAQHADVAAFGRPQRELENFAAEHHIPSLNLLSQLDDILKTTNTSSQAVYGDAGHMNTLGSLYTAEIISTFLEQHVLTCQGP